MKSLFFQNKVMEIVNPIDGSATRYGAYVDDERTAPYYVDRPKTYLKILFAQRPDSEVIYYLMTDYSCVVGRHSPTVKRPYPHYHGLVEFPRNHFAQSKRDLDRFMREEALMYESERVLYPCNYLAYVLTVDEHANWSGESLEFGDLRTIKDVIPDRLWEITEEEVAEKKISYRESMEERLNIVRAIRDNDWTVSLAELAEDDSDNSDYE